MTSKTINRVWLGSPMPEDYREYGEQWLEMNPGWRLHDWTDEEVFDTTWFNQEVINQMIEQSKNPNADKIAFYTHVADVIDYEIIYHYGGLYLNTDIKPIRPLECLYPPIETDRAALAMEDDVHAVNMAMYGPSEHQFFGRLLQELPKRYRDYPKAGMHVTTGVGLIMQVLAEKDWNVTLWHRDVWNPIHWGDIPFGTKPDLDIDYPESTVGSHFWTHRLYQRGHEVLP